MKETMTYKGYTGSVEYSVDDRVWRGKILYIKDLVTYEADYKSGLYKEFVTAVDDYLETCKELHREPDEPNTEPQVC